MTDYGLTLLRLFRNKKNINLNRESTNILILSVLTINTLDLQKAFSSCMKNVLQDKPCTSHCIEMKNSIIFAVSLYVV